jgi:hypothetical protein
VSRGLGDVYKRQRFDSEIPLESAKMLIQEGNYALTGNVLELAPRSVIVLTHDWM